MISSQVQPRGAVHPEVGRTSWYHLRTARRDQFDDANVSACMPLPEALTVLDLYAKHMAADPEADDADGGAIDLDEACEVVDAGYRRTAIKFFFERLRLHRRFR